MLSNGTFYVELSNGTEEYFQAFGGDNATYFNDSSKNPYYEYHFSIDTFANGSFSAVIFTDGTHKIFIMPNMTVKTFYDGSKQTLYQNGNSIYSPSPSNHTNSSNEGNYYEYYGKTTEWTANHCNFTQIDPYDNYTSSDLMVSCENGTYFYYPPLWRKNYTNESEATINNTVKCNDEANMTCFL